MILLPHDVSAHCVRCATTAPSLHNSQPWRFDIRGPVVDVYADPARRLRVLDPEGREQLISVGAAVFTLRLALRRAGYASDARLFPSDDADLVARVTATHHAAVTPAIEALAAVIPHRHTNRWPFAPTLVPAGVLDQLRDAARWENVVLAAAGPTGRDAILNLAWTAERRLRGRPGYQEELGRWTGGGVRRDGVPAWAAGPQDTLGVVPIRDFAELSTSTPPREEFEPDPTIAVLATVRDRRPDWVCAGQALQRVLLAATAKGLTAMPISQPVEVPAVRRLLLDPSAGLTVQMVLRIGYGRPAGRTPRRPLSDVLLPAATPEPAGPRSVALPG